MTGPAVPHRNAEPVQRTPLLDALRFSVHGAREDNALDVVTFTLKSIEQQKGAETRQHLEALTLQFVLSTNTSIFTLEQVTGAMVILSEPETMQVLQQLGGYRGWIAHSAVKMSDELVTIAMVKPHKLGDVVRLFTAMSQRNPDPENYLFIERVIDGMKSIAMVRSQQTVRKTVDAVLANFVDDPRKAGMFVIEVRDLLVAADHTTFATDFGPSLRDRTDEAPSVELQIQKAILSVKNQK